MYKLVASDMDETFLDGEHRIPAANLAALKRMRELGVLFVPSSGRPYASIVDNFKDVDPSLLEGTYVISYNGGFINRFGDPEPLRSFSMDWDVALDIYARGRELGLCQHVYTPSGRIYVCDVPESERTYLASLTGIDYFESAAFDDLSFVGNEPIVKILYMSDDFPALKKLGAQMAPELAARGIAPTYSSGRYLEFMTEGIDKGTGLVALAEMLGIEVAETIGVGDSANDHEMIKAAGLGVGVANVTDEVRPDCDVVLDTAADDGAFGELVERFLER